MVAFHVYAAYMCRTFYRCDFSSYLNRESQNCINVKKNKAFSTGSSNENASKQDA